MAKCDYVSTNFRVATASLSERLINLRNSTGIYNHGATPIGFEGSVYDAVIDEVLPGEDDRGSVLPNLTDDDG